ncbi:MAG: CRTAC1 family protein [Anaerolineae bacterium]
MAVALAIAPAGIASLAMVQARGQGTIRFVDVTAESGASLYYTAQDLPLPAGAAHVNGVAWADIDGDHRPDLFLTNDASRRPSSRPVLYHNMGGGRFEDITQRAGISMPLIAGGGATFADYDNDGDPDLFVATAGPNALFRNDGFLRFTDVTARAGLGDRGRGHSASWSDYDNDGDLDLYVANWDPCLASPTCTKPNGRDGFYRNEGDGTFTPVGEALLGVRGIAAGAFIGAWFDYDNDGDGDLLVVNDSRGNYIADPHHERHLLWRNDGPGGLAGWRFTEVAVAAGLGLTVNGMGVAFGDYDRDGSLDVYTTHMVDSFLLRNLGDGSFADVTAASGAEVADWTWGPLFFDADNDGWEDIFVAVGHGTRPAPSRLFRNRGDGSFEDVTASSGLGDRQDNRAVAYADYDNDGDLDLYLPRYGEADDEGIAEGGAWGHLLRNESAAGHWVELRLEGVASNRDGVGARVILAPAGGRPLVREVAIGTAVGASSDVRIHFGLGPLERVPVAEVRWPSGTVDRLPRLWVDRSYHVVEGRGAVDAAAPILLPAVFAGSRGEGQWARTS